MSNQSAELKIKLKDTLGLEGTAWSLGRLYSFPGRASAPAWGLFVFDASGDLHFVNFHQNNWYSALVKNSSGDSVKADGDVQFHLHVSRAEVLFLEEVKERGILKFLKRSFPLYHLKRTGSEDIMIFELESPEDGFKRAFITFR